MTVEMWLEQTISQLHAAGIATARLDALVLSEDCLGRDRAWLLAHPEQAITASQSSKLAVQLARRAHHEPLAYIRGHAEFYGREFFVNADVLVPRPESEAMIGLLLWLARQPGLELAKLAVADIGSGSGCLGVTAALELARLGLPMLPTISFHDIDPATLAVARRNAEQHGVTGNYYEADLLGGRTYDVLLANLPYVPNDYPINQAANHEPKLALFSGPDGLEQYRRLFGQIAAASQPPSYILTESLPKQHAKLRALANESGYTQSRQEDFIQLFSARNPVTHRRPVRKV